MPSIPKLKYKVSYYNEDSPKQKSIFVFTRAQALNVVEILNHASGVDQMSEIKLSEVK